MAVIVVNVIFFKRRKVIIKFYCTYSQKIPGKLIILVFFANLSKWTSIITHIASVTHCSCYNNPKQVSIFI